MRNDLALSLLLALLVSFTLGSNAAAQVPIEASLTGKESLKITGCGKDTSLLSFSIVVAPNGFWSALINGNTYAGTHTTMGSAVNLTLSTASLALLDAVLESAASELCETSVNITSVSVTGAQLKLNKQQTAGKLKFSATATGSSASGSGTGSYQIKAAGSVRRGPS